MDFIAIGEVIPAEIAKEIQQRLIQAVCSYRFIGLSECIPMACQIKPMETSNIFENRWFDNEVNVIVFFENYNVMVLAQVNSIILFLANREPWEEWDVCIFNQRMTWCVALTHNDDIKFVSFI